MPLALGTRLHSAPAQTVKLDRRSATVVPTPRKKVPNKDAEREKIHPCVLVVFDNYSYVATARVEASQHRAYESRMPIKALCRHPGTSNDCWKPPLRESTPSEGTAGLAASFQPT